MTVALRDRRTLGVQLFERAAVKVLTSASQRTVYLALLTLSGQGSLVWASQATIADEARVSERTVRTVLPELEDLGVLRRAPDEVLERLAERLQEFPATVVYELISLDPERQVAEAPKKPAFDERRLDIQVMEVPDDLDPIKRRSAVVGIIRRYMSHRLQREIQFPWLIKLYNNAARQGGPKAGEAKLVEAAVQTVNMRPAGDPLGYMTKVMNRQVEPGPSEEFVVQSPDLGDKTQEQFGWDD